MLLRSLRRADLFERNYSFSFADRIKLVCSNVFDGFDFPRVPTDLDRIDLRRFAQSEMKPEIILRQVTAPASNFISLDRAAGNNLYACTDRKRIALDRCTRKGCCRRRDPNNLY